MAYNSVVDQEGRLRAWAWHPTTQPAGLWTSESSRSPVRRVRPGWQYAPRRPSGPFWNARDARAWSRCCRRPGGNRPVSDASIAAAGRNVCPTGRPAALGPRGSRSAHAGVGSARDYALGPVAGPELAALGWRSAGNPHGRFGAAVAGVLSTRTRADCDRNRTSATATERPATVTTPATADKRPATAVAGGDVGQPPDSPGPQSRGVDQSRFQKLTVQRRRSTPPSRPADAKPPQPGPFTSVGKQRPTPRPGMGIGPRSRRPRRRRWTLPPGWPIRLPNSN